MLPGRVVPEALGEGEEPLPLPLPLPPLLPFPVPSVGVAGLLGLPGVGTVVLPAGGLAGRPSPPKLTVA